jgi:hypothetical protein
MSINKKDRHWAEIGVGVEIESSLDILSRLYTTTNYNDWKGNDQYNKAVSSGVYYYQIDTEKFSISGRMLLIK